MDDKPNRLVYDPAERGRPMDQRALADFRPLWTLVPGFPLGEAARMDQVRANTVQQVHYILDQEGKLWAIDPEPDSVDRKMVMPSRPFDVT